MFGQLRCSLAGRGMAQIAATSCHHGLACPRPRQAWHGSEVAAEEEVVAVLVATPAEFTGGVIKQVLVFQVALGVCGLGATVLPHKASEVTRRCPKGAHGELIA